MRRLVTGTAALTALACATPAQATPTQATPTQADTTAAAVQSATMQAADPVRLRIPSIGLTTRVIALELDRTGKLIAPKRYDLAGWNVAGPEPGEKGAAVIAGHVDSRTGPAVFYGLRRLKHGDRIHVDRADGSTVTFKVRRLAGYAKNRIPDKQVYGSTSRPELRLITCGGPFDKERRSYRDNLVIFAS
ncbi:class F sortase [Nonomuraea africana]|uniref:class F sortase n=1 Tax=Nonomuraea africana TaxID=46171 RepID=UPI0033C3C670